jgi:hypothetical protein
MTVEQGAAEVLNIFDVVKQRLNGLFIEGIESFSREHYSEIVELKDKLKELKLNLIVDLLEKFIASLDQLKNSQIEGKAKIEAATNALRIIATTRMFESVMNVELIKEKLLPVVDS